MRLLAKPSYRREYYTIFLQSGQIIMFHQPRFPRNKGISLSYLNVRIPKVVVRCFALGRLEISLPRLSCGQWCLCLQDLGHGDQSTGRWRFQRCNFYQWVLVKRGGYCTHLFTWEWLIVYYVKGPSFAVFWTIYVLFSMGNFLAYFCRFENNQMLPCLSRLYLGNINKNMEEYNP